MQIQVRLFAILREKAGTDRLALNLPDGASVARTTEVIGERVPEIRAYLPRAAFAVNQAYVSGETVLNDGDELALIPPVSGG